MTSSFDTSLPIAHYEISDPASLSAAPVISVLMLAYNHGAYLEQAIESVLAQQTDFPFELLIGEDCSTDGTRDIALRYQIAYPSKVRIITAHVNVGMQANGQRLTDASRGEFTAYCEGDDYWNSALKLQLQVDYLRGHPEVGAVHTDFDHTLFRSGKWRTLRNFLRTTRERVPEGDIFSTLLTGNFIQTCTLCTRTDLVLEYLASGLPIGSYAVGDWPLCLYISAKHKIAFLEQSMATYRKVPGSVVNSGDIKRLSLFASYESIIDDMSTHFGIDPMVTKAARISHHRNLTKLAFVAGDLAAFEKSRQWLEENTFPPEGQQSKFLHMAMSRPLLRSIVINLVKLRRQILEFVRYRNLD